MKLIKRKLIIYPCDTYVIISFLSEVQNWRLLLTYNAVQDKRTTSVQNQQTNNIYMKNESVWKNSGINIL